MSMTAEQAFILSKKYVEESLIGGGAVKGKNCVIESITPVTGGHKVGFKWTLDNGTVQTDSFTILDGVDGESAYEIAVAQGYVGTEEEWLASLKGEQGEKGDKGVGIESVTKESTAGLVDTYLILFADGTTTTYNVTNGANITKVSQLENDSEFITNATIGLINYYLKDEVYSKSKIDELLRNIGAGLSVKIVPELPTEEISGTTIYLINTAGSNYNQYMYIDDAWASLGSTSVDLSSYYNKTQIDTMLLGYVSSSILLTQLLAYTKTADLAKVARTNSYNDLDDLPEIPDVSGIKPYVDVVQDSSNTAPTSKVVYDAVQTINESLDEKADADDVPEIDDTSTTDTDKVWSAKKINDSLVDKVPFKFGITDDGQYGYIKDGADTVTPFKSGGKYEFIPLTTGITTEEDMYNVIGIASASSSNPTFTVNGVSIPMEKNASASVVRIMQFQKIDFVPKGSTISCTTRGFIIHEVPPIDSEKPLYIGGYAFKQTVTIPTKGDYIVTAISYSSDGNAQARAYSQLKTVSDGTFEQLTDTVDSGYSVRAYKVTTNSDNVVCTFGAPTNTTVMKIG